MNKIVVLSAPSSAGKDYIAKKLQEKFNWHFAISYTTRPMRDREQEGKEYYFLEDNKEFEKLYNSGFLFERTEYNSHGDVWMYGLGKKSFVNNNVTICILNPFGIRQLLESELSDRLEIFYVYCDFETRFFRALNRTTLDDDGKIELIDRVIRDEHDFKDFHEKYGGNIINNENETDIDDICDNIYNTIYAKEML